MNIFIDNRFCLFRVYPRTTGERMNFRDPKLVFVKNFRGDTTSFLQVSDLKGPNVHLKDVESGGDFIFTKKQIEMFVASNKLKVTQVDDLPPILFDKPLKKREVISRDKLDDKAHKEMERRYQYVLGVIDEGFPAYTPKWLDPYIIEKAQQIKDEAPPSYRSLARWMKVFVESGWEKKSLLMRHDDKGSNEIKLHPEVNDILKSVVREHTFKFKRVKYMNAYRDFLQQLDELNVKRKTIGQDVLEPCSYKTLRHRFGN